MSAIHTADIWTRTLGSIPDEDEAEASVVEKALRVGADAFNARQYANAVVNNIPEKELSSEQKNARNAVLRLMKAFYAQLRPKIH